MTISSGANIKPFLGQKQGPTKNEMLSRAVEHRALKDAAAKFTTLPDELLADGIVDHYPEMKSTQRDADFLAKRSI